MSRRTAKVEDFDDDTDLPLPSRPLPNTGTRGPLLQQVDSDEEDDLETGNEPTAGPATIPQFQPRPPPPPQTQYEAPIQMIDKLKPDQKTYVQLITSRYQNDQHFPDGHASTLSTSMPSVPTARALVAYPARKASGGH